MDYWTLEVLNGAASAWLWQDAYGDALVESAQTNGILDWQWSKHQWGVVLELAFRDEADWLRFRRLPTVRAALDAVPDPLAGLLIYNGRGGASGVRVPRRRRNPPNCDAAFAPVPAQTPLIVVGSQTEPPQFAIAGS